MPNIGTFALSLALVTISLTAVPTACLAYTQEEQAACQPDAFRLCGSEIPNVDRVTACMVAKRAQLSPECKRYFRADPEPAAVTEAPAGRPVNIRPRSAKPVSAKSAAAKPSAKSVATKPASAKKPATPKPKKPAKPAAT